MTAACTICGQELPVARRYNPRPDGMYDLVEAVDLNALRSHLLDEHPLPALRVTHLTAVAR